MNATLENHPFSHQESECARGRARADQLNIAYQIVACNNDDCLSSKMRGSL